MDKSDRDFRSSLIHVVRTDVGMRRANNQDSYAVVLAEDDKTWQQRGHVFLVADGMGAHAAGELASKLAADGIPHLYQHYVEMSPPDALERAIIETNSEIHRRGKANADFHAMGTTASALVLRPGQALIGHVGDSRIYRLRGDRLEQLTFDHSLVWELRAAGQLHEGGELARAVPKNVITRSLGPNAHVEVDLEGPFSLEVGDAFLLCSDGLSGQVEDEEIGAVLASLSPQEAVSVLIDLANLRGGPDNVTVIVAKVGGQGLIGDGSAGFTVNGQTTSKKKSPANPAAWVVAAVCCLIAPILWLANQPAVAAVVGVAAAVAVIVGIVLTVRSRTDHQPAATDAGVPLGKAPYVKTPSKPGPKLIATLAGTVGELREAAVEGGWGVDWKPFDQMCAQAEAAGQQKQFSQAVGYFAKAISFMMQQLRQQQNKKASDSSIEY